MIGRDATPSSSTPLLPTLIQPHRLTHLLSSSYLDLEQKKEQMTQTAKAEALRPVQDWEEGKFFPRGRERVRKGRRMIEGQTQTLGLSSGASLGLRR